MQQGLKDFGHFFRQYFIIFTRLNDEARGYKSIKRCEEMVKTTQCILFSLCRSGQVSSTPCSCTHTHSPTRPSLSSVGKPSQSTTSLHTHTHLNVGGVTLPPLITSASSRFCSDKHSQLDQELRQACSRFTSVCVCLCVCHRSERKIKASVNDGTHQGGKQGH